MPVVETVQVVMMLIQRMSSVDIAVAVAEIVLLLTCHAATASIPYSTSSHHHQEETCSPSSTSFEHVAVDPTEKKQNAATDSKSPEYSEYSNVGKNALMMNDVIDSVPLNGRNEKLVVIELVWMSVEMNGWNVGIDPTVAVAAVEIDENAVIDPSVAAFVAHPCPSWDSNPTPTNRTIATWMDLLRQLVPIFVSFVVADVIAALAAAVAAEMDNYSFPPIEIAVASWQQPQQWQRGIGMWYDYHHHHHLVASSASSAVAASVAASAVVAVMKMSFQHQRHRVVPPVWAVVDHHRVIVLLLLLLLR